MASDMEHDLFAECVDTEEAPSPVWYEDLNTDGYPFDVENLSEDHAMKEGVVNEAPDEVDLNCLFDFSNHSQKGSSQLAHLIKHWEYRQANIFRLLEEELDSLNKQRLEVELRKLEILEEHRFEKERFLGDKIQVSILDDLYDSFEFSPEKKDESPVLSSNVELEAEYDTAAYWRQRALELETLLDASLEREDILMKKLQETINNMEKQSTPMEELSQMLTRADNFLHFILQNAPIVIAHLDKELRYRFIYNHFPTCIEEELIGKTDNETFSCAGVKECLDFKREVLERGLPGKREITIDPETVDSKTFLVYVEPVFDKAGETIGVNYIGMDITDQVKKREKMAKLREELAVQRTMETELNKTIHLTEETMRVKQALATMSHEIRSPLSGVVSMAEILSHTNLDNQQRELLDVMISSGDLVLQLINDILDLSKVESGVMELEATKFRPREVVKHVLQTAAASLRKKLTLEGHVAEDIPVEVIGDVLRLRQILTNLVSNAAKFTEEGQVGIRLNIEPNPIHDDGSPGSSSDASGFRWEEEYDDPPFQDCMDYTETATPFPDGCTNEKEEKISHPRETIVWLRCDVYDTGIGIPEHALPTLFKSYVQVSADHARKYGGTGLGLAICKQLVDLMGGYLTVTSKVHEGSIFTFVLPYKVSNISDERSDDTDGSQGHISPCRDTEIDKDSENDFYFQPKSLGCAGGSGYKGKHLPNNLSGMSDDTCTIPAGSINCTETSNLENVCLVVEPPDSLCDSTLGRINGDTDGTKSRSGDDEHEHQVIDNWAQKPSNAEKESKVQEVQHMVQAADFESPAPVISDNNLEAASEFPAKPRILLAEDKLVNVAVARQFVRQMGHSMDVVSNGMEAVQAVQRHEYDLILMDVCMPVMDGLEATRIIRAYEQTGNWNAAVEAGIDTFLGEHVNTSAKKIPIIAMTANSASESAEECYENGMDSFVSKPINREKLKQCLEQYLTTQ